MPEDDMMNDFDISSIGEALDWSPKALAPKRKKKTMVRLVSYSYPDQCFSTPSRVHSQSVIGTPGKTMKSSSVALCHSVSPIKKRMKSRSFIVGDSVSGGAPKANSWLYTSP